MLQPTAGTGSQPLPPRYRYDVDDLEGRVTAWLNPTPGLRVSIVVRHPGGPNLVAIAPNAIFHAASTMKLPVLVELYRRVEVGSLTLDDTLTVTTAFRSLAGGSVFTLEVADDSERGLYGRLGERVTVRELARLMVTVSSNVATNMLVETLGAGAIRATMAEVGALSLCVLRGVEDGPAHDAGLDSTVTAGGLADLLDGLARGHVVSPTASREMVAILADQAFNQGIPAGLPPGTRVAHKTGSITHLFHDAGIVLDGMAAPLVIVVLTEGLDEEVEAPALVAAVTREVYAGITAAVRR